MQQNNNNNGSEPIEPKRYLVTPQKVGGGPNYDEEIQRGVAGVAVPPSNNTFRRIKEPREKEEYVIRERYLQNWTQPQTPLDAATRQSSAMLTPESPEDFRLRVLRTAPGSGGGEPPPTQLYPPPSSSFFPKHGGVTAIAAGPRPSHSLTSPAVVPPPPPSSNQELRFHPFAQDSLFRHQPSKPFRGPDPASVTPPTPSIGQQSSMVRHTLTGRPVEHLDLNTQQQQTWHRPVRESPPTTTVTHSVTPPFMTTTPKSAGKDSSTVADFPTHFRLGSLIQLSNGDLKTVENLTTEDFIQSAETSPEVRIDHSVVTTLDLNLEKGTANITFSVGKQKVQVQVESTIEHPFFVFNNGWSSASPDRTLAKYRLPCKQLRVGDICISLQHEQNLMKPPLPPTTEMLERRRSLSASPSDKILKRPFYSSTSPRPSPLASAASSASSPSSKVSFADPPVVTKTEENVISKRSRNNLEGATPT